MLRHLIVITYEWIPFLFPFWVSFYLFRNARISALGLCNGCLVEHYFCCIVEQWNQRNNRKIIASRAIGRNQSQLVSWYGIGFATGKFVTRNIAYFLAMYKIKMALRNAIKETEVNFVPLLYSCNIEYMLGNFSCHDWIFSSGQEQSGKLQHKKNVRSLML